MNKICSKCKVSKELKDFYKHKSRKDGFHSHCKMCMNSHQSEYRKTTEAKNAYNSWRRKYHKTEKGSFNRKNSQLKRRYGISLDEFNEILIKQNNVCAICKLGCTKLVVDHCHISNIIRGILCQNCNAAIGMLKDSKENLLSAIEYLSK